MSYCCAYVFFYLVTLCMLVLSQKKKIGKKRKYLEKKKTHDVHSFMSI